MNVSRYGDFSLTTDPISLNSSPENPQGNRPDFQNGEAHHDAFRIFLFRLLVHGLVGLCRQRDGSLYRAYPADLAVLFFMDAHDLVAEIVSDRFDTE
jgi:hypothetical protein